MNSLEQRQQVIEEAKSWLGTPYHINARLKGIGVDCATFIWECFLRVGFVPDEQLAAFKPDFHLHRGEEVYVKQLQRYCHTVAVPQPGDIVTYQYGRIQAHGALIIAWPRIIHVDREVGVTFADARASQLAVRQGQFWSYWGWAHE